jgi:hypothetical protein
MNTNNTLRNKIAPLALSLLVLLAPACGDDSAPAKTGGFGGLGTTLGTKDGKMTVTMNPGQAGAGAAGNVQQPAGQVGGVGAAGNAQQSAGQAGAGQAGAGQAGAGQAGAGQAGAAATLAGTWHLQEGVCALVLVFQGSRMAMMEGCQLDDGTVGVDIEEGNFTVQGSTLSVTSDTLSCSQRMAGTKTATFRLNGNSLTITPDGGQPLNLTRGEANLMGTQAVQGCLTPEGFTAQ